MEAELCLIEPNSFLMEPTTSELVRHELAQCPKAVAVLGESAVEWQHTCDGRQEVEAVAASTRLLADSIACVGAGRRIVVHDPRNVSDSTFFGTEGAAKSTVLKVTLEEPGQRFEA